MNCNSLPISHGLILDVDRAVRCRTVLLCHTGDHSAHRLNVTLTSGGTKVALPENTSVTLYAVRGDGTSLWSDCTVEPDGTVSHVFTSDELAVSGNLDCELYIVTESSEMTTPCFRICVDDVIRSGEAAEATDNFTALGTLISQAENLGISLSGNVISLEDKDGGVSTVSFVENEDGTCEIILEDAEGNTSSVTVSGGVDIPDGRGLLCVENDGTLSASGIVPGSFGIGSKAFIMCFDNGVINADEYSFCSSVRESGADADTNIPTEKAVRNAVSAAVSGLQTESITDAGGYFTSGSVEGALQELGQAMAGTGNALDGLLTLLGGDE